MLKRFLWVAAVVLVANAAALAVVARNGRGAPDAVVTLTEREMRLTTLGTDTTGMTLTLQWDRDVLMPWFDRAKLRSIGFDCSMEPDAPGAFEHYSGPGLAPRTIYLAFEYAPAGFPDEGQQGTRVEEPQPADRANAGQAAQKKVGAHRPRLRPIDVGNDPQALRAAHPDRHRYLVTAGVVRLRIVDGDGRGGPGREGGREWAIRSGAHQPARLEGLILDVLPEQVYVPQAMQRIVMAAVGERGNREMPSSPLSRPPRYEVTVEYGSGLLPRIVGVKAIGSR